MTISMNKHEPEEMFYPKGVIVAFSLQKIGSENVVDKAKTDHAAAAIEKNAEGENEIESNNGAQDQNNTDMKMAEADSKEEAPSNEEARSIEEAPSKEEAPSIEEAPSKEEAPPNEAAPSKEEAPAKEETPSKEEDTTKKDSTVPRKEDKGDENRELLVREDIRDAFKVYGIIKVCPYLSTYIIDTFL